MKVLSWLFLKSYSCSHSDREKAALVSAAQWNSAVLVFWYSFQIPAGSIAHLMVRFSASQNSCDLTLAGAFLGSCMSLLGECHAKALRGVDLSRKLNLVLQGVCRVAKFWKKRFHRSIKRHKIRAQYSKTLAFLTPFALIVKSNSHSRWSLEEVLRWWCTDCAHCSVGAWLLCGVQASSLPFSPCFFLPLHDTSWLPLLLLAND